jgi:hypothetical protein
MCNQSNVITLLVYGFESVYELVWSNLLNTLACLNENTGYKIDMKKMNGTK